MTVVGGVGRGAFAKEGIRLVKKEYPVAVLRSPMYFDTIIDKSTRYTSMPFLLPSKVAASVLPVPGGP